MAFLIMRSAVFTVLLLLVFEGSAPAKSRVEAKLIKADGEAYKVQLVIRTKTFSNKLDGYFLQYKIKFYNSDGEKFSLNAQDIQSVEFDYNGDHYLYISISSLPSTQRWGSGNILARVLTDGHLKKLRVYERHASGGYMGSGGIMVGGTNIVPVTYLMKGSGMFYYVKKIRFNKDVSELVSDYTELSDMIRDKALKYKDLDFIIDNYNTWYTQHH